jgi:hypothetical protein
MIRLERTCLCFGSVCSLLKQAGMIFCLGLLAAQIPCGALRGQSGTSAPRAGSASDSRTTRVLIVNFLPDVNTSEVFTNDVISGCTDRIDETHLITVIQGGEMNRKEAEDWAKANEGTDVLWIELLSDPLGTDKAGVSPYDAESLIVDFVLFTGGTGKIKTQGHAYQHSPSMLPGQVGKANPLPSLQSQRVASIRLYQAGRDVGDRVIKVLNRAIFKGKGSECFSSISVWHRSPQIQFQTCRLDVQAKS